MNDFTVNMTNIPEKERLTTNLIVCDGNQSKDYRNLIFDENFRYIGVASVPHSEYKQFTVIIHKWEF